MTDWLLFYLTTYDYVKFVSSDNEEVSSLSYKDFLNYLPNFYVKDFFELKKELNTFRVILLNTKTGEWEIKKKENLEVYNFSELHDFTEKRKKKEELKNRTVKDQIQQITKSIIKNKNFFGKRK